MRDPHSPEIPIIQYDDDTLIVMEAYSRQLITLKAILHSFRESTGLKVNYSKSVMVPINISEESLITLQEPSTVKRESCLSPTLDCPLA